MREPKCQQQGSSSWTPTSILIAAGPHVTVNTIVGLPFIQATRAIIDLSNMLQTYTQLMHPFPIEHRCAMVHVPIIKEGADCLVHLTAAHQSFIQTIEHLEAYFSCANVVLDEDSVDPHVSLGTCPGMNLPTLQTALAKSSTIGVHRFVGNPMDHYCNPTMSPNDNE